MKKIIKASCLLCLLALSAYAQEIGKPLPAWQDGMLDIHHINTGRGDAAFCIFPDGTTMLFDAGELDPTSARTNSPRNAKLHPNDTKTAGEWVAWYIKKMAPAGKATGIDYALISHFHDDHFGGYYKGVKQSEKGGYFKTGITSVGDELKIGTLIDRGYPAYDFPVDIKRRLQQYVSKNPAATGYLKSMQNYWDFIYYHTKNTGMKAEKLQAGKSDQIVMRHQPDLYKNFKVQNIKVNGTVWTGQGTETINLFPFLDAGNTEQLPSENQSSLAIRLDYGDFSYYTGGDNPGIIDLGAPGWTDVETPMAEAIGAVDVAVMDHHGNRDSHNAFNVKTLRPRVWISQTWSSDHPGHEVLRRVTSEYLYPGPRDLFATNMLEANILVIGDALEKAYKSMDGHIVVRVLPGGQEYFVIILNDENEANEVKAVFGPYQAR